MTGMHNGKSSRKPHVLAKINTFNYNLCCVLFQKPPKVLTNKLTAYFFTNLGYGREESQAVYPIGAIARGPMGSGPATGSSGALSSGGPSAVVEPDPYPPRFEAGARSGSAPYRRAPVTAGTVAGGTTHGYGATNTLSIGPTNIASSSGV